MHVFQLLVSTGKLQLSRVEIQLNSDPKRYKNCLKQKDFYISGSVQFEVYKPFVRNSIYAYAYQVI